jgi:hypothetical protein
MHGSGRLCSRWSVASLENMVPDVAGGKLRKEATVELCFTRFVGMLVQHDLSWRYWGCLLEIHRVFNSGPACGKLGT